jgi:hypothetical protein
MNLYLIEDNEPRYGVNIIIVNAETPEEALNYIGGKLGDTYQRQHPTYNLNTTTPNPPQTYLKYTVTQIPTNQPGIQYETYYGE